MKPIRAMLLAFLLTWSTAQAALVSADSPLGSASAVLDTNTGWQWLQLSATRNLTIAQSLAATSPGGTLSDFHFATRTELCTLTRTYLGLGCTSGRAENVAAARDFFAAFGIRLVAEEGISTFLEPTPFDPIDQAIYGSVFIEYLEPSPYFELDTQRLTLNAARLGETGLYWIVREEQPVPEPSGPALLAIGIVMLARRLGKAPRSRRSPQAHRP